MKLARSLLRCLPLLTAFGSGTASAVEESHFEVKNAADLIAVCTTAPGDSKYTAALHFCHGYVVGAYHYYESLVTAPMYQPLFCPDDKQQPRDRFIKDFIAWAKAHPQYNNELAVHVLFKYMIERWPCTRQVP